MFGISSKHVYTKLEDGSFRARHDVVTQLYFLTVLVILIFFLFELRDAKRACACTFQGDLQL